MNGIEMYGCRENNLKNLDIIIPYSKIVVFTGVSGSGKSSIAFDTLYAEGKRRYIESIGINESYFLSKIKKPEADLILGVPPAIALEQNKYIRNPRSTVGTISQINPYIQLLFASCGITQCEFCNKNGNIGTIHVYKSICSTCNKKVPPMTVSMFSVNSPNGMCNECGGTGELLEFDETLIWPNQNLSISQGGIKLGGPTKGTTKYDFFNSFLNQFGCTVDIPINLFPNEAKVALLFGVKKSKAFKIEFPGIIPSYEKIYKKTKSVELHSEIESYMVKNICSKCKGTGLNPISLNVTINNKNIIDVMSLSIDDLKHFFTSLQFGDYRDNISAQIKDRAIEILKTCISLGIGYLSLTRKATTLSGGEMQRIRLVSQISSQISGVVYVLDEPSIGMHHSDVNKLVNAIKHLNNIGSKNTIILVEHDLSIINVADYVFEIGPGAGTQGGEIIAQGTPKDIINNPKSITGKYLSNKAKAGIPNCKEKFNMLNFLEIQGANANNLNNVNVKIPLNCLVCITGVSGSGKSSLIFESFYNNIHSKNVKKVNGLEKINRVILSDQSPIGKSSRSCPVTYSDTYILIRKIFAQTNEARKKGYDESYFSFNSKKGCCEECKGEGHINVDMSFLPEMNIPCEACNGQRFKKEILDITYLGKNISDVLYMTVDEALTFFSEHDSIISKLRPITEVGLGYIRLGQPTSTLSGGESQRLKLAYEISKGKYNNSLFIFDEPSTGLHFEDIKRLLEVFKKLLAQGNSIILIEHNLDIIGSSEYIIDVGLGAGVDGGNIVGIGTPLEISKLATPTGKALHDYFTSVFAKD